MIDSFWTVMLWINITVAVVFVSTCILILTIAVAERLMEMPSQSNTHDKLRPVAVEVEVTDLI